MVENKGIQQIVPTSNVASGGKVQNVYMPNQSAAIVEFYSKVELMDEIKAAMPIEAIMIDNRAIGNEDYLLAAANDCEFSMISLIGQLPGCEKIATYLALEHRYHREGLRAIGGFERTSQVTSKSYEELTTKATAQKKPGLLHNFIKGKPKQ